MHDTDRALNNELPCIDLCLGGLNLQKGRCNLWCVCCLHDFKAEHLDAADVTLVLHKVAHAVTDQLRVTDDAFLAARVVRELTTYELEHFERLVCDVGKR